MRHRLDVRSTTLAAIVTLAAASAVAETYAIDPKASHVRIHLGRSGLFKFMGHEHHIEAPITEGRVEVVDADPARSSVSLRFGAAALYVIPGSEPAEDIPKVEERMRGEVLEVARHPEIAFASNSVRAATSTDRTGPSKAAGPGRWVVSGTLTLKGRAFPVEIPLAVERRPDAIEARGEVELNLRDLGIEPPSVAGVVNVSNRFKLAFEIKAAASAAQP